MCTSPITIRYSNLRTITTGWRSIQVPCGKCCECKKQYQDSWSIRIYEELKACGFKATFVTLTYAPEHVPTVVDKETGATYLSVCKRHCQNVIKRFRTSYKRSKGKDAPLRYFLTSEYGPRTLRPHYHAIFFGLNKYELKPLTDDWAKNYGFVKVDDIRFDGKQSAVCRYVAKYCSKGVFENPLIAAGFVAPTFHLMSKGIGRSFLSPDNVRYYTWWKSDRKYISVSPSRLIYTNDYLEFVGVTLRYYLDGFAYKMPRYYKVKLYGTQNDLSDQVADFLLRRNDELYRQQCELISSQRHCSLSEASYYLALQQSEDNTRRENEIKDRMAKFYDKSKV